MPKPLLSEEVIKEYLTDDQIKQFKEVKAEAKLDMQIMCFSGLTVAALSAAYFDSTLGEMLVHFIEEFGKRYPAFADPDAAHNGMP